MNTNKNILISTLAVITLWLAVTPLWPCGGTPVPNCGRTVWLALLAPRNVLFQAGVPIQVPVGVMPYVFWNTNPACAQPAGGASAQAAIVSQANLVVNVTCTPIGGNSVQLGPFNYTLDTPSMPGVQPDSISFDIPVSNFDGSVPVICDVAATYSVEFSNGTGSGTLSSSNQTEVCIVPPSPDNVTVPRLDLQYVPKAGDLFETLRKGDQSYFSFLVSNNDLQNSVDLTVTTNLDPRGGLPDGFDPADPGEAFQQQTYAIQDPLGDFYPHAFVMNPATWPILLEGNPRDNPASRTRTLMLKAGESKFVTVAMSSIGMCGKGSCNKLSLRVEGMFSDGSPALGCASTALLVGDVPQQSARCEVHDVVKAGAASAGFWTPAQYFDEQLQPIANGQTLFEGTEFRTDGSRFTFTNPGESFEDNIRFQPSVRPVAVAYNASFSSQFGSAINLVSITGLPNEVGASKGIPAIFHQEITDLRASVSCEKDSIRIYDNAADSLLHAGKYSEFAENPPEGFNIDVTLCRTFTKTAVPDVPETCPDRYHFQKLVKEGIVPNLESIKVFDQLNRPIQGMVEVMGDAADFINLQSTSFSGQFMFSVAQNLPTSPNRVIGMFRISSPGSVNDRLLPITLARLGRFTVPPVVDEAALLRALRIAEARAGHTDIFVTQNVNLTNLSFEQNSPTGDFITVEGDIRLLKAIRPPESNAENSANAADVIIDGSDCPAPCDLFNIVGNFNSIRNIRFQNFPETAVSFEGDSNSVAVGEFVGNEQGGVRISGNGNRVGGSPEDGNDFSDNGGPGVVVENGTGNSVLFNTFADNTGLAIDLGGDGVTENDGDDTDVGANHLQNFPELTNVQTEPENSTLIEGTLNSAASTVFTLQFFASDACDASGNGEGARFLGSTVVTTDASGGVNFSVTVDSTAVIGEFITATATDSEGNTSEFSDCFEITTAVAVEEPEQTLPTEFALFANYPNPFNPETIIEYALPLSSYVQLTIFNLRGQPVRVLVEEQKPAGLHKVKWNGRSDSGTQLASGVYVYRLEADGFVQARKLTLLK